MSAVYSGQKRSQRRRRDVLERIRSRPGNRCFADFIIDQLSENGPTTDVENLAGLAELWVARQSLEAEAADDSLAVSVSVDGRTASAPVPHAPALLGIILRAGWMPELVRLKKAGKLIE